MSVRDGDPLDLGQITPPTPPSDKPDEETRQEQQSFKQKSPSPTDRMVESHAAHCHDLNGHIDHHKRECNRFREELATIRSILDAERARAEVAEKEVVKLRESSWAVGWMMLFGNSMIALGSVGLGVAGCWPDLSSPAKYSIGGGGVCTAICGVLLTALAFFASKRAH